MALELTQVSFSYAEGTSFERRALADVDLGIERGSVTLVLGPTGSGKSTLLRIASGLLAPSSGSVTLDGTNVDASVAGREGGVGLVFQSPENQLFAETIADDVAFGPRRQGRAEADAYAIAHETLGSVGLDPDEFGLRSPFSLSGGEARRAALAGTLATRPAYLLLDEPTAGLDARGRAAVLDVIDGSRDAGIVIVTHDVEQFLHVADSALVLSEGSVGFTGPTAELVADPDNFRTAGLAPPAVLALMDLARDRHGIDTALTADPVEAAKTLASLGGWSS